MHPVRNPDRSILIGVVHNGDDGQISLVVRYTRFMRIVQPEQLVVLNLDAMFAGADVMARRNDRAGCRVGHVVAVRQAQRTIACGRHR